jgi:hypothetical protein
MLIANVTEGFQLLKKQKEPLVNVFFRQGTP